MNDSYDRITTDRLAAAEKLLYYVPNNEKMLRLHKSDSKTRLILGGKRSGKSTFGVVECCWAALGIHPFISYPPPPLKIRICSVDFTSGIKGIILPMLYAWLPKPARRRLWAEDRILELTNGTQIDLKSYDQDLEKFEGVERHLVWMDEEPPKAIYQSNYMRTISGGINGKLLITCTPLHGLCFDEETEILSSRGWVHYNELQEVDKILTFNKDRQVLEWLDYDLLYVNTGYNGPMISLKSQGFDALVTPDHKWPVIVKATGELKIVQTKDLGKHQKLLMAAEYADAPIEKTCSDDFVRLIGWIITEGTFPKDHPSRVVVTQSLTYNKEKCDEIRRLCNAIVGHITERHYGYSKKYLKNGWKEYPNAVCAHFGIDGPWAKLVRTQFPNKTLTSEFILSLTKDQLWILYETMLLGDGHRNSNGDDFTQNFGETIENFQILCVLLGLRSTLYSNGGNSFRVHVGRSKRYKPFTHVCSLRREVVENYRGVIWCPHTKNETVVMRRNGVVSISSNTWLYDDLYDSPMAKPPYVDFEHVSILENPHLQKEAIMGILHDPAMKDNIDAAVYGQFVPKSGLVYKMFNPDIHVIDQLKGIPSDLMIVLGIDPHDRNPHGVLFGGLNSDNTWVIFDEVFEACIIDDLVKKMKEKIPGRWPPQLCIMDTSGYSPQSISGRSVADELKKPKYGLYVIPAHKDVQAGRLKLSGMLDPGTGKKPQIFITRNCTNLVREFRHYVWDEWARKKDKANPKERPMKKDDHLLDALRYMVMADVVYRHPGFKLEKKYPEMVSNTGYYLRSGKNGRQERTC